MDKSRRARRACARVLTNMVRERGDEKSPRRLARASDAVLVNNGFLEDSVTRSQAFCYSRARKMRSPCKQQEKSSERGPQAICVRSRELGRVLINASTGRMSAFGGRGQLVTATPLVVYRQEFRIPRSSVDVD